MAEPKANAVFGGMHALHALLVRRTADPRQSLAHFFLNPLAIAVFALGVVALVALGLLGYRQAVSAAKERLRAAATDVVEDLDNCVSQQLAYIGKTICDVYATPDRLAREDFARLMKSYALDEMNVIDARGVIQASNLPIVGDDQWKKVNPAKFNQALLKDGKRVYSQPFRPSADEPGVYYKYVGVAFPPPARGYLQIGFKRARLQNSFDYSLRRLASARHIGESGFFVISKTVNGAILSSGRPRFQDCTLADAGFDVFTARRRQNEDRRDPVSQAFLGFARFQCFISRFGAEKCLCTSGVVNNFHRYTAAIPFAEILRPVLLLVCALALAFLAAFVLVAFFLTRLSDKNRALETFIRRDKEQREKDLAVSKTIQVSSLPAVFPDGGLWKIYARMDTAREVGGDFYDFATLPSGKLFFLIADVSGKGIPAAMFMMKAKTTLRAEVSAAASLADAVEVANRRLAENNDAEMFVTAWIGLFDPDTGHVEYVNAGHNPPLVKRAGGTVEWVRGKRGLVLAALEGTRYTVQTLDLAPGDSLCLYTDGVTEAMDADGQLFGEARLVEALRAASPTYVEEIRHVVTDFASGAEQADDITLLALDRKAGGPVPA